MEVGNYLGKNVRIILKNGFHYGGRVIDTADNALILIDRYSKNVFVSLSEVAVLEVVQ